jgi:predicted XRE-type DNA-binding protein
VFSESNPPDAEDRNAKAQIAYRICRILEERELTHREAAALLGLDQPKICPLMQRRFQGFSSDKLSRFLKVLNCESVLCSRLPIKI